MVGALGVAALLGAAPSASADPAVPAPPAPVLPAPTPLGAPAPLAAAAPLPLDQPLPAPAEMQHLTSPENLPPGATMAPTDVNQGRGVSYLRELWHAVQTQEVSKSGALLLLTQRPMNPDSPAGMPVGPQAPLPDVAPAPLPPAPPVVP
ncbi:hypothetical protein BH10ACT9_BH10ACT9_10740 [soil metagenome]